MELISTKNRTQTETRAFLLINSILNLQGALTIKNQLVLTPFLKA